MLAFVPNVLVVNPSLPAENVKDLIALAKKQPGTLDYSSSGPGTLAHLAGELFKTMAGVNIVHIPYQGSPQALTAVLAGETIMMFSPVPIALPHIKSGRLRVLALPDVVEKLSTQGAEPAPSTPEALEAHVKSEIIKWAKVVKASGAQVN